MTAVKQLSGPIRTGTGFTGKQIVFIHEDGSRELAEVELTRTPDGSSCRHIFAPRSNLDANVHDLASLHPHGGWQLTGPETVTWALGPPP
jgi:hypothetical protein